MPEGRGDTTVVDGVLSPIPASVCKSGVESAGRRAGGAGEQGSRGRFPDPKSKLKNPKSNDAYAIKWRVGGCPGFSGARQHLSGPAGGIEMEQQ